MIRSALRDPGHHPEASRHDPPGLSVGTLIPILVGFVAVSIAFNAAVPLLEAPDETSHVAMVRFVGANHALPVQRPPADFPVGQEGSQPPLYYILGAALFQLSPAPALAPAFPDQNPFVSFQRLTASAANRNFYGHTAREAFPWRGDVLGVHLVRLVGLIMGCVTVWFTFLIAREIWPRRMAVAALAAGLVAFNPQFAFISGVVNNDSAMAAGATAVLWCLTRWIIRGGSYRLAAGAGLALAAALLAKTDGVLLIPLVAIVLALDLVRTEARREALARTLIVCLLAVVLAGWWFGRNQILYGDPLGYTAMLAANHAMLRPATLGLLAAVRVLWNARGTFWGVFGWTNILYPPAAYRALDALVLVSALGLVLWVGRALGIVTQRISPGTPRTRGSHGRERWQLARAPGGPPPYDSARDPASPGAPKDLSPPLAGKGTLRGVLRPGRGAELLALALNAVWLPMVFASLVHWVQLNDAADQWRLFFAAIAPAALFMALGLDEVRQGALRARPLSLWKSGPDRPPISSVGAPPFLTATAFALVGLAANGLVIATVIVPAFYPTIATATALPSPDSLVFGGDVELVSSTIRPSRLHSGEPLEVDLRWRARRAPAKNWSVSLGVVDDAGATLARVQSWPEGGRAPTTAWQPGLVYEDRYVLTPTWTSADPRLASVWLNLYDASVLGGPSQPVANAAGKPLGNGVAIGTVKLLPSSQSTLRPGTPFAAHFGTSIDLVGYDAVRSASQLRITLYWHDRAVVKDGYTVFVHVADRDGRVLAQNDSPPRDGAYPTTEWEPGETIRDPRVVDLKGVPTGSYQVLVGIYLRATGQRLTARLPDGTEALHDAVRLFDLGVPAGGQ